LFLSDETVLFLERGLHLLLVGGFDLAGSSVFGFEFRDLVVELQNLGVIVFFNYILLFLRGELSLKQVVFGRNLRRFLLQL